MCGGDGIIVEIDEAFISRRKYNRGRRQAKGLLVVGLTEVNTSTHEIDDPVLLEAIKEREAKRRAWSQRPRCRFKKAKTAARSTPTAFSQSSVPFDVVEGGSLLDANQPNEELEGLEREIQTIFSQRRKGRPKKTLFFIVENKDASTLTRIIKKFVLPGSTIFTDEWGGYCDLTREGYTHKTICHLRRYSRFEWDENEVTRITTNHIERMWVELRKTLKSMTVAQLEKYILLKPYRLMKQYKSTDGNVEIVWTDLSWFSLVV